MAIEWKKYAGSENTLEEVGTVKELAGKGGKIALIRKNYNDATKRVAVVVSKKDGTSAIISCSKQVSQQLRKKHMNIAQLAGLTVVEGKNAEGEETYFVAMPATGGLQEFAVDGLKASALEVKTEFLPEELIAF